MSQIKPQKLFLYFWLFLPILFANSCGTGEIGSEVTEENNKPPVSEPLNVRVVVPYAGNMPGFMNYRAVKGADQTEFQSRILKLLTRVNQSNKEVAIKQFFLVESANQYKTSSFQELYHLIDGTKPKSQYSESVDVPKLFREATEMKDFDKSVTVIVTDLVHNGSVKTNLSAIKTLMTDALAKSAPKSAVSLFAETSKFDGTFYPALRDRKEEHLRSKAPYYIIVIGPAKQVSRFNKAFLSDAPVNQVHFGLTTPINYKVLTNQENTDGVFWHSPEDPSWKSIEANMSEGPIEFIVGLDLSSLPSSLQTPTVLAPVKVNAANATVSAVGGITKIPSKEGSDMNGFTHTIKVRVDKMATKSTVIKIVLPPPSIPKWVTTLNLEDDNYPMKQQPGTYKLSNIISGIEEAYNASYQNRLPPIYSIAIQFKNDE